MPNFRVSVVNQHFSSSNDHEFPDLEAARKHAIQGAIAIGTDEVIGGEEHFVAELILDQEGRRIERFVISVGASPLQN